MTELQAAPNGWTFFQSKTSIFTMCWTCGKKVNEFFYKHQREREGGPLVSRISCGPCLWQSGNVSEGGAPVGNQNSAGARG